MNPGKFYSSDPWLNPFISTIERRIQKCILKEQEFTSSMTLCDLACGHHYYGLHKVNDKWIFREWAPKATEIYLTGSFNEWRESDSCKLKKVNLQGDWEIVFDNEILKHGDLYKLSVHWDGGNGERIPSYAKYVIQDDITKIFSARVWDPETPYQWKLEKLNAKGSAPVIYEAHIGMATEEEKTGSYHEFTKNILPLIAGSGYNTVQLMAIQEHPFYGSFGYHVSNYFAASSRFGSPDELKELIDTAHGYGLRVIMDLVHSHSVKNTNEGLGLFDGSEDQYFHTGEKRNHQAWDSLCFNYGKNKVLHFLLSNCRFWLEEYKFDGFRFDGVTSMIYYDHGLEKSFVTYNDYFDGGQDEDALIYLYLANKLIHSYNPQSVTIAEEMSGMPGIAAPIKQMGYGFDFRLSMGVPDFWIKMVKDTVDELWEMDNLMHELTQHRPEEKIISYCESHDQALVGDKTLIFRMIDAEMYTGMAKDYHSLVTDRGIALHKMIRLLTFATSGGGYLNFMGNEFGHPEWIDFPREGNGWSYKFARRQWHLALNKDLKYQFLASFDREMLSLNNGNRLLENKSVNRIIENNFDKVIVFARGDYLFVFNFHPTNSYTDYGVPLTGKFKIILDTDDPKFGGFNRLDRSVIYSSVRKSGKQTLNSPFTLYLYIPARTASVFKKEPVRRITDI
jgi:1,4-alpha-glucan branching enzyme